MTTYSFEPVPFPSLSRPLNETINTNTNNNNTNTNNTHNNVDSNNSSIFDNKLLLLEEV